MSNIPAIVDYHEHTDLHSLEVDTSILRSFDKMSVHGNVVALLEEFDGRSFIRVISFTEEKYPYIKHIHGSWPVIADAVIAQKQIIAVRAGFKIQIYDMIKKERIESTELTEVVRFWKFFNDGKRLVLVTKRFVYFWDWMVSEPVKAFSIFDDLDTFRIMNYRTDKSGQYHILIGLTTVHGSLKGLVQLYSSKHQKSQLVIAFGADFHYWSATQEEMTMLCFVNHVDNIVAIHTSEIEELLGSSRGKKTVPTACKSFEIVLNTRKDNVVGVFSCSHFPLLHLYTKLGNYMIVELYHGTKICEWKFGKATFSVAQSCSEGLMGITREGKIIALRVRKQQLIEWLLIEKNRVDIALQFLHEHPYLEAPLEPFAKTFMKFFQAGKYENAAHVASLAPKNSLRSPHVLEMFANELLPTNPKQHYFTYILRLSIPLKPFESRALLEDTFQHAHAEKRIEKWASLGKLVHTDAVSSLLKLNSHTLYENIKDLLVPIQDEDSSGYEVTKEELLEIGKSLQTEQKQAELNTQKTEVALITDDPSRDFEEIMIRNSGTLLQKAHRRFGSRGSSEELLVVKSPVFE